MTRIAIYPGSFDPITRGHEDLVQLRLRGGLGRVGAQQRGMSQDAAQQIVELVGDAAGQVDHDDRLVPAARSVGRTRAEELRQRQAADGEAPDLQERPPRQAVAVTMPMSQKREHGCVTPDDHLPAPILIG